MISFLFKSKKDREAEMLKNKKELIAKTINEVQESIELRRISKCNVSYITSYLKTLDVNLIHVRASNKSDTAALKNRVMNRINRLNIILKEQIVYVDYYEASIKELNTKLTNLNT
jgi:hypothetical protein